MPWQYQFELLARPYGGVSEGPVWDGEAILFTHIPIQPHNALRP